MFNKTLTKESMPIMIDIVRKWNRSYHCVNKYKKKTVILFYECY